MISSNSRLLIKASVPVLREHGLTIAHCFYRNMFATHPELRNLFNMGNQARGAQQASLAAAVFAYAANIDNPTALNPVLERIAHKHAAVGIKPAHYPIVGRYLLGAIREVLGKAATPELLTAWDEAFWLLAGELIAAEARLYSHTGHTAGDLMPLQVSRVIRESDEALSFLLQTANGQSPGKFQPGQYVSVAVTVDQAGQHLRQLRQYSLCGTPTANSWRICVKRLSGGGTGPAGCVSTFLHTRVNEGDTLWISAPYGNFTPPTDRKRALALLSAGVGVTPMAAVLSALPTDGVQPVLFAHAARSTRDRVLVDEISKAQQRLRGLTSLLFLERPAPHEEGLPGRMTLPEKALSAFRDADFYMCGPLPFMQAQWQQLSEWGIPPERLHREVFGPEALEHLR